LKDTQEILAWALGRPRAASFGNGTVHWSWGTIQQSLRATSGGGTRWHGDGYTAKGRSDGLYSRTTPYPAGLRRNGYFSNNWYKTNSRASYSGTRNDTDTVKLYIQGAVRGLDLWRKQGTETLIGTDLITRTSQSSLIASVLTGMPGLTPARV
jgi:hypothetical protein